MGARSGFRAPLLPHPAYRFPVQRAALEALLELRCDHLPPGQHVREGAVPKRQGAPAQLSDAHLGTVRPCRPQLHDDPDGGLGQVRKHVGRQSPLEGDDLVGLNSLQPLVLALVGGIEEDLIRAADLPLDVCPRREERFSVRARPLRRDSPPREPPSAASQHVMTSTPDGQILDPRQELPLACRGSVMRTDFACSRLMQPLRPVMHAARIKDPRLRSA